MSRIVFLDTETTGLSPDNGDRIIEIGCVELLKRRLTGVIHMAGSGSCSWYELAVAAFERTGTDCVVKPCTTEEFGRPAPRPAYSVLRSERGDLPPLPRWEEGLAAHLAVSRAVA